MSTQFHSLSKVTPNLIVTARFAVHAAGAGFTDITGNLVAFLSEIGAREGALFAYLRHTSASLVIQENADPDVRTDLMTALDRLAPADAGWRHDTEGPDDMPAHVKTMLTGVSLHVPVMAGAMTLGTWQGIYLVEHRTRRHAREILLQFIGTAEGSLVAG
jgi:secondary thiamine-phosphate synthase enzyme